MRLSHQLPAVSRQLCLVTLIAWGWWGAGERAWTESLFPALPNTVFLAVNGDDYSARREAFDRPFGTLGAALAALRHGDTLQIRPGIYRIGGAYDANGRLETATPNSLLNLSNITVLGYGATLQATNYGTHLTIDNCQNIKIAGLTFTGSTNGYTPGLWWMAAAINHRHTNSFTEIRDCTFRDLPDQAISHLNDVNGRPSDHWTIQNCTFDRVGWITAPHTDIGIPDGAAVSGRPRQLIFTGNRLRHCAYGVELDGGGVDSPPDDLFGQSVISGNVFEGVCWTGVVLNGELGRLCRDVVLTGNYFDFSTNSALLPVGGGMALVSLEGVENVVISGNVFRGPVRNSRDRLYGVELGYFNIGNPSINSNILIQANIFEGLSYGVGSVLTATAANWVKGVRVVGNTFNNQGEAGLHLCGTGLEIVHNKFHGSGRAPGAYYPWAMWLYDFEDGPLQNCLVAGNVLDDVAPTPTTQRLLTLSSTAGTRSSSIRLRDNECLRYAGTNAYAVADVTSVPTLVCALDTVLPNTGREVRVAAESEGIELGSTPTIAPGHDGQCLNVLGCSEYTVTLQSQSVLPGSGLELSAPTRTLGRGDILVLRFDGLDGLWYEVSFADNGAVRHTLSPH